MCCGHDHSFLKLNIFKFGGFNFAAMLYRDSPSSAQLLFPFYLTPTMGILFLQCRLTLPSPLHPSDHSDLFVYLSHLEASGGLRTGHPVSGTKDILYSAMRAIF